LVSNKLLASTIPVTEHIKDELDAAGDSQLLEDAVDVIPDGIFLHPQPLSDFAVLHAVGDETDHILLATGQERHSFGIVQLNRLEMGKSFYEVFEIFVADPKLSLMDCLDAFREGFQGMTSVKNASRTVTNGVHQSLGFLMQV
jgi:hypothetical protein